MEANLDQPKEQIKQTDIEFYGLSSVPESSNDWLEFLQKYSSKFNLEENLENAALLLDSFVQGMRWLEKKSDLVGSKKIKFPFIGLTNSHVERQSFTGIAATYYKTLNRKGTTVVLNTKELSFFPGYPPHDYYKAKTGNFKLKGKITEIYGVVGVEEYHHAKIVKPEELVRGKTLTGSDKNPLSVYQADDAEYWALQMQLKYSQECHFSKTLIEDLERLLDASYEDRLQYGVK